MTLSLLVLGLLLNAINYGAISTSGITSVAEEACPACVSAARKLYQVVIVKYDVNSITFFLLVGSILSLEYLIPAHPRQRLLSVSFFHDILWCIVNALSAAFLIILYWRLLWDLYQNHLTFLRIDTIADWHPALQIGAAILVSDFIRWFHHFIRHKITPFWFFHAVHHSQRELNLFSDLRVHPVERVIEHTVRFIPFFAINSALALHALAAWHLFGGWYARFYHSNVRTNLDVLRYVLVTPQSHRVHHSIEPRHQDRNFGAILSIWDYLFGTQYRKYDEYPDTGISDNSFPHEDSIRPVRATVTLMRQLIYPFRLLARYLRESAEVISRVLHRES